MVRFIELFAGIGGFRVGLERVGFKCVWANEWDKYACQIYRKNFGEGELYEGDIRTVDPIIIPEHDLITAGFPCQSFSIAGKRGGIEDTRGTLFFEICRIARAKRTPYLLLENVPGLISHGGGHTFQTIIKTLDELGYDCEWQVLNSFDFGKGERPRIFIAAVLRNHADNGWQGNIKALPLLAGCDEGIRYEDFDEQKIMRNSERIVRKYARLPNWLDSWDTFYPQKEMRG